MSPEQARADKDIDTRADLWSLGVLIFRMLTGKLPFEGEVMGAILSRMLVDPPPSMAQVASDLPETLDAFFAQALAKRREDRFQNVRALVSAFLEATGMAAQIAAESTVAGLDLHAVLSMRTGSIADLSSVHAAIAAQQESPASQASPSSRLPPPAPGSITSHLTPVSQPTLPSRDTPPPQGRPTPSPVAVSASDRDSAAGPSNPGDPEPAGAFDDGSPVESPSTSQSVSSLVKSVSPDAPAAPSRRSRWIVGAVAAVVLCGGAVVFFATRDGDGTGGPAAADTVSAAPSAASPGPSSAAGDRSPQPTTSAPQAATAAPGASASASASASAAASASVQAPHPPASGTGSSGAPPVKGGKGKGKKPTDWGF
jgi:serine/threonine-protein kinase